MRLIDADDIVYDSIDSEDTNRHAYYYGTGIMAARKEDIDAMPTIELPERKTGKWIYSEDEYGIDGYHCDKCGFFVPWDYTHKFINYIDDYHYCPNCGHPMGGDGDE